MAVPASLRAPISVIPGLQPSQLQIEDGFADSGSLTLRYIGDAADGLRLNPMFPGRLAFKPASPSTIPIDPGAPDASTIPGHLFLSISPRRLRALSKVEPGFRYPLLLIYHNVVLDPAFFSGTVVTALRKTSGSGFVRVKLNGQRLNTAAELSHAFARGKLGIWLYGSRTHTLPLMPSGIAGNERIIELSLGVRTHFNPFHRPLPVSQLPDTVSHDPETFVPLPMPFFVARLRQLAEWDELVHDDFTAHPFWDAVAATSPGYRRLRLFLPGPRPDASVHVKAYDDLTLRATHPDGSPAWTRAVNRLGDVYLARDDNVDLNLAAEQGGLARPLDEDPEATSPEAEYPWPATPTSMGAQRSDLDLTVFLDLTGDPLTLSPPVPLHRGMRDHRGLTIHRGLKRVVAEQELISPLQSVLRGFGWAPPETGLFGRRTRRAVRGFQRQARTTDRLDASGVVDSTAVTPWTGSVTGRADADTLAQMRHWRNNDYRSIVSDQLWDPSHSWSDTLPGGKTYAENYHDWVDINLDRFNHLPLLCNWFPILLLVEYAAAHGLRIKLRYWSPTDDEDMLPIHTHDSHGGEFDAKSRFYRRTRSTVTSRMIGQLNTEAVSEAERKVGDLIVLDYGDEFFTWHSYVITDLLGGSSCRVQSGNTSDDRIPRERTRTKHALPDDAYEDSYRRWNFSAFD